MKLKLKHSKKPSNIVYYDSNTKIAYNSVGNNVVPYTKKMDNKLRIVSTFPFDTLMKATLEVPKTIDEIDIDDFITEQAYKQLNLPQNVEYQIYYLKIEIGFDADNWNYDVYAIDSTYLEKTYGDLADKTNYIDVATSVPFLPLVLYKTNTLDAISNHIFVFIGDNSGIFAFYCKGEPVYVKILNSNIHKLRVEFNQESSLELNSLEFENVVAAKSPDVENYKNYVDSMLNKISRDIEENIMYIRRVYQDLEPTSIYYGMSIEYDEAFLTFFKDTFLIDTRAFSSLTSLDSSKGNLVLADLSISYANYLISHGGEGLPNFSHLKRPKPLAQRESGQFVMVACGIFVLSLVYPIYNFGMMGFFSVRGDMLQTSYDTEIFPKAEEYRAEEERLKIQIEDLQNQNKSVNEQIAAIRNDMSDIHAWQVGYIQKSKILDDILKVAKDSDVQVIKSTVNADDRNLVIELNLFARKQENLTQFIKILNEQNIYKSVITDKIEKITIKEADQKAKGILEVAANAVESVSTKASNAIDSANAEVQQQLQPIPADMVLDTNEDLGKRVVGYLNSIVKVVVK